MLSLAGILTLNLLGIENYYHPIVLPLIIGSGFVLKIRKMNREQRVSLRMEGRGLSIVKTWPARTITIPVDHFLVQMSLLSMMVPPHPMVSTALVQRICYTMEWMGPQAVIQYQRRVLLEEMLGETSPMLT